MDHGGMTRSGIERDRASDPREPTSIYARMVDPASPDAEHEDADTRRVR